MIDGLLTFARLESGAIEIEGQPMDAGALAREAVAELELARTRGVRVELELPAELPPVFGDPKRLRQVLDNLIGNAVKFTQEGRRVVVRLRQLASQVEVEVEDEGIGIPAEHQQRIFERFYQVDASSTRAFGGIGLGLSIVRQILDAHGTGIEVDSAVGRGSTFRFRLPLAADFGSAGAGQDVVIVDDDAEWVRSLSRELRDRGWRVRSSDNCAGASRLVRECRPSVIVLDRLLGDGDGFDLLAQWRREPALREVPVVVVSVRRDEPLARRLGATAYLVKPVSPPVAADRLARWVEGVEGREPGMVDEAPAAGATEDTIPEGTL
jgi:CheY-like chemotaxis protein